MIQEKLNKLKPYFKGLKVADNYRIVEFNLKSTWLVEEDKFIELQQKPIKESSSILYSMFYSDKKSFDDGEEALEYYKDFNYDDYKRLISIKENLDKNYDNKWYVDEDYLLNNGQLRPITNNSFDTIVKKYIETELIEKKSIAWNLIFCNFYNIHNKFNENNCIENSYFKTIIKNLTPVELQKFISVEFSPYHNIKDLFVKNDLIDDKNFNTFINVINELNEEYQKKFVEFCGINNFNPNNKLQVGLTDKKSLLFVKTCFNYLAIPQDNNKKMLTDKIKMIIDNSDNDIFLE